MTQDKKTIEFKNSGNMVIIKVGHDTGPEELSDKIIELNNLGFYPALSSGDFIIFFKKIKSETLNF